MLLTGTFARSIDEKQRIAVPKLLREMMGCGLGKPLFVTPGTDGALAIYTEESLERFATQLAQASPNEQHVRAFTRLFYARAQRVDVDHQGRIRIPADLAKLAGLETDAVLLGVQDHLEIWAANRWADYLSDKQDRYDEIAEAALRGSRE